MINTMCFAKNACCLLLLSLLLQACALPQQSANSAPMDVDVAESLNIADFHGDNKPAKRANDKTPVTANPDGGNKKHTARADYQPSQGPADAYTAIHKELYQNCPTGWTKQQEWTQADDGLFYIYIRASCR